MQEQKRTGKMSGVKKQFYRPRYGKSKYYLEPGLRGFFCTCNFREKDCVKEAYNLLNEYDNKLYGSGLNTEPPPAENPSQADFEGEDDISDQLKKEVEQIKSASKRSISARRFQAVETGASNCVFIRTNLPKPEEITTAIFQELLETKTAKTRYLLRIVPIMATCKTNLLDIMEAGGKLFDEHFLKEPSTFSIVFNRRLHNTLSRDDVIKELADLIVMKNSGNKADLKNPKKAVIVEIIKGICLISVVDNYYLYRKFNMFEICKKDEDQSAEKIDKGEQIEATAAKKGDFTETEKSELTESNAQKVVDEVTECENEKPKNHDNERGDGDAK